MSKIETEIKIKVSDTDRLEKYILEKACKKEAFFIQKSIQNNLYFKNSSISIIPTGELLRLREERTDNIIKYFLTHKGQLFNNNLSMNLRTETEIEVNDKEETKLLLEKLGFTNYFSFEKKRSEWKIKDHNSILSFDEIPLLGTYIEIEAESPADVLKTLKYLDIIDIENITKSYLDLLWELVGGYADSVNF